MKIALIFALIFVVSFAANISDKDWNCADSEDYFVTNCPIKRGDYNGCCLCTQVNLNFCS